MKITSKNKHFVCYEYTLLFLYAWNLYLGKWQHCSMYITNVVLELDIVVWCSQWYQVHLIASSCAFLFEKSHNLLKYFILLSNEEVSR